ncbi:MAG TPA: S8 family serine peptidase [Thermoanaerobaculia bacterium]|nr:S8 family serine peptidase [Thermoanaerobaculia bacterium]
MSEARRFRPTFAVLALALLSAASPALAAPPASLTQVAPGLPDAAAVAARAGEPGTLLLRAGILDPLRESLDLASVDLPEASPGSYGIVQFHAARFGDREELARLGVELLAYLPNHAFQVRWSPAGRLAAMTHPAVRFAIDFAPALKVAPELWPGAPLPEFDLLSVSLFKGADLAPVAAAIEAALPSARRYRALPGAPQPRLRYLAPRDETEAFVRAAAAIEAVAWVEPYRLAELHNDGSVSPIQNNATTGTPIWDQDLIGTGQIVSVSDSGLDRNQCWFTQHHDGTVTNTEITDADYPVPPATGSFFPLRKVVAYWVAPGASPYDDNLTCPGGSPTSYHGTHTTGTVAGDKGTVATPTNPSYLASDRDGMAPNARILFQDVGNDSTGCLSGTGGDIGLLFEQANAAGAFIHSNSWGAPTGGAYGSSDQEADAAAWRLESSLIVFSAGNSGSAGNTIGSPGVAKNVLTVGALGDNNSTTVAGYSSRGPTDDGRIKPDIMAPGTATSALGDDNDTSPGCPSASTLSGTSMACPTVAGGAALQRQYFTDGFYPSGSRTAADLRTPSGALMKAVLLNGTLNIANMPNNNYGWGRIWLHNNLYFANVANDRRLRVWSKAHAVGLTTSQSDTYSFTAPAGAELRVTLAWFDAYPALGAAVQLVNNLDLEVTAPGGAIYRGNVFSGGVSVTGGSFDLLNTVEQVRFTAPAAGAYTVRVIGTNVPGNGDPYTDRQGYGLAASFGNCAGAVAAAPTGFAAAANPGAGIDLAWVATAGATNYLVYRAPGSCATAPAAAFDLVGAAAGTTFTDLRAQGGFGWAYKVRGADGCAEGPLSACADAVATGRCDLFPAFDPTSLAIANPPATPRCDLGLSWASATSSCPLAPGVTYDVHRSTQHDFVPSAANRIATGVAATTYTDLTIGSHTTYYYAVRALDSSLPPNVSPGVWRVKGTATAGSSSPGTWTDGADSPSYMALETPWSVTAARAAAGQLSYRNAADGATTYLADTCAAITTPDIPLPAGSPSLSYAARWNLEAQWDGVVVEISTNGGASWTDLPPAGGYPGNFSQTGNPPINACGYAASRGAYNGSSGGVFQTKTSSLAAYAGQTVRIRWRFSSDPGAEEEGFYLDQVAITGATVPDPCVPNAMWADGFESGATAPWAGVTP